MTFARTLILRIAVVALLCSATTAVLVAAGYVETGIDRVERRLERSIRHARTSGLFEGCDSHPNGWRHEDSIGIVYTSGKPLANASIVLVPQRVIERLQRRIQRPGRPCSQIVVEWSLDPRALVDGRRTTLLAMSTALTVSMGLAVIWVGSPLRKRIRRLRTRAARVGQADFPSGSDTIRDEIGEVDAALARADARIKGDAEDLRRRSETIKNFLADFAHDSRTPITALGMLLEELAEGSSPSQAGTLGEALKQVVYLRSLANNMRLSTQLNEGWDPMPLHPTSVDLQDVAQRAVGRARVVARHTNIELSTELDRCTMQLRVDELLVEQAISNILDNALVHATGAQRIEVRLTCADGGFTLSITDDGIGLAADEVDSFVGPRGPTSRANSGLGLAIVKRACESAGWSCTFDAHRPRGLRVTLSNLP